MIPDEALKLLAPLGVGGVLAAVIFLFYRRDLLNERADREKRESILIDALTANTKAMTEVSAAVQGFGPFIVREVDHAVRAAMNTYALRER